MLQKKNFGSLILRECETRDDASKVELFFLKMLNPKLNTMCVDDNTDILEDENKKKRNRIYHTS